VLARKAAVESGVYVMPAFVGSVPRTADPDGRGAILGLNRGVGREHPGGAASSRLAYQTRDVVETMAAGRRQADHSVRVDGGAAANDFLMQFQADILGTTVDRPKVVETTATGAAVSRRPRGQLLDQAELERVRAVDKVFKPKMSPPSARRHTRAGRMPSPGAKRAVTGL